MLKLQKIFKSFHGRSVLHDLSLAIVPGDFLIIMGSNGAGKSTLFDIIAGATLPDAGTVWIDEQNVTTMKEQERSRFIGRVFQNTYLGVCPLFTVRENLAMANLKKKSCSLAKGLSVYPEKTVQQLLSILRFDLEKIIDLPMSALSGGQRQMIAFIMAVLSPPSILLLDEPTAALDPLAAQSLLQCVRDFAQNHHTPTVLITHDPMTAKHLGNRLVILDQGKISREFGIEKRELPLEQLCSNVAYEQLGLL